MNAAKQNSAKPSILITGASGGLACLLGERLKDQFHLVGVDPRPALHDKPFPGEFHRVSYTHRKMTEIFRKNHFSALVHLGRIPVSSLKESQSERFDVNVLGTRHLLQTALKYEVKSLVVMSTFHVYGAHQHNHIHISEEDPLRASQTFPELADAVELDHVATSFMHQHRDVRTVILRPVNVVGPQIQNHITRLLRGEYCPILWGYDPMQQFIHESDFVRALELALESKKAGIYNVAGEGAIPFVESVRIAGAKPVFLPHFVVYPSIGFLSSLRLMFPKHLADYFRYPVVLTDKAFRRDFGFVPEVKTVDALRDLGRI